MQTKGEGGQPLVPGTLPVWNNWIRDIDRGSAFSNFPCIFLLLFPRAHCPRGKAGRAESQQSGSGGGFPAWTGLPEDTWRREGSQPCLERWTQGWTERGEAKGECRSWSQGVCVPHWCWSRDALCELGKGASLGESPTSAPRWDPGLGE